MTQGFIKGVDVSILNEIETFGGEYFLDHRKEDLIEILRAKGINLVRLRLWVDPYDAKGNPYLGGTNDLATTISLAKRIKEKGMKFMLDLHYSDFWTDPKKQQKPKSWEELSGKELEDKVYQYTKDVLITCMQNGVTPEYIQIGNEITNGMLWPDGKTPTFLWEKREFEKWREEEKRKSYDQLAKLLNAGVKAVREMSSVLKIILHLDFGGANNLYRTWFDEISKRKVDYDIIGLSYYPYWHGSLKELELNLLDIGKRYEKDLMIVETAYAYTDKVPEGEGSIFSKELADVAGYPPTVDGQAQFLTELMDTVKKIDNQTHKGLGIVYWEPAWLPVENSSWASTEGMKYGNDIGNTGNHWANQGLFDFEGNALESLNVFKLF
ncbi:arabinogalactan endo-1,4-beta-galactosidase [Gracilibacillus ureilyticus]|uniref:Arabinogalactan endo-beta-1,4-galactanase n=1 Tax=Gracilibacillus ureilyticus TaxID=531814 RepID=A0A1H9T0V7_9BACI|nr:glycosyl hydrolase 53 family protein [Gracilibacillus ureilyticus]SER90892.1 arabinogalactan endo-1,4-beta-galactosidase [Gracilibacillus ureilyticus]